MEEVWKDIPEYNGRYQASTLGRIRSTSRIVHKSNGVSELYEGKILKPFISTGGYLYVTIAKEANKFCPKRLHRLIALTFIANPYNLPQINHINEDKKDNRVENLEWCNNKYNSNYGHRVEKFTKANRNNPSLSKEVNQYDLDGNYLNSFPSAAEAARHLGGNIKVKACRIGQCCRHLFKNGNSAYGYLWEFSTADNKGKAIAKLQKNECPIYQYSTEGQLIKRWDNIRKAAKELNLNESNINRANRYGRTCGGFKWSKILLQ